MTLPVNPNAISLSAIQGEFGGSNPISLSEYYAGGSQVAAGTLGYPLGVSTVIPSSGVLRFANFHGASAFISQIQKLLASDPESMAQFGTSVAISANSVRLAVGAATATSSGQGEAGAVYIFTRPTGTGPFSQYIRLSATTAVTSAEFGASLAISADGAYLVVGAPRDRSFLLGNTQIGSIYIFNAADNWSSQVKLLASDYFTLDLFGGAVAISADGTTVAVGARGKDSDPYTDNGAVYIFTRSGASWSQQAKLLASDPGTGKEFGQSIALSADGNTLVVGSFQNSLADFKGCIYIFRRIGAEWSQLIRVTPSIIVATDEQRFGKSVAISAAGDIIQVGSDYNTYFYRKNVAVVTEIGRVGGFGTNGCASVSISTDGTMALVGSPLISVAPFASGSNHGVADYINGYNGSSVTRLLADERATGDRFGISVALTANGRQAVVGAYQEDTDLLTNNGAAYVFERPYQQWSATQLAIFAFGETSAGIKTSNRNLVNALGVVSADEATVGTGRSWLAAAGYGGDKAIFGFGFTAGDVVSNFSNKVTNTGIVLSSESTLASSRGYVAATGYGVDKAIFGFGYNSSNVYVSSTNHVDNNGNMSSDINLIRTIRGFSAAARFGSNRAMFLSGGNTNPIPLQTYNIVNDSGLIGADLTFSGDGIFFHAGAAYGGNEAIFGFGSNAFGVSNDVRYITNTGVVGSAQSTIGLARNALSCTNYGGDKAIFGFGFSVARVNITNLVSNTGQVAADVSTLASAKNENAAAGYGF